MAAPGETLSTQDDNPERQMKEVWPYNRTFYWPNDDPRQLVREFWPFNNDEVIICVDVECHCFNQTREEHESGITVKQKRVCEVGFTILDSRDVIYTRPGDRFQKAWPKFRSFSMAIKENLHEKSGEHRDWCKVGSAEDFMFGTTQWLARDEFRMNFVATVNTFVRPNHNAGQPGLSNPVSSGRPDITNVSSVTNSRPVVFVVFGGVDKSWLKSLDVDLEAEFPNSRTVDIQRSTVCNLLEQHLNKQHVGASDLFAIRGIETHKIHHGGNDSVYEMQAFLAPFAMTSEQWQLIRDNKSLRSLPPIWEVTANRPTIHQA